MMNDESGDAKMVLIAGEVEGDVRKKVKMQTHASTHACMNDESGSREKVEEEEQDSLKGEGRCV